ncbi:MAG: RagB/SusD family nutrient uptake outer membrane protein [Prevotellaceae bacterium]|jgi:hypothetical protein|nr:RagB/SusD family nutrient uptake outer membrane protein [Prevotellaceae bacterium]
MKNLKLYIISCLVAAFCVSCEGLLDFEAQISTTEEDVVKSYESTMQRAIGLYSFLPDGLSYIDGAIMASASDEAEHTLETSAIHKFNTGAWNAVDNPDNAWERNFKGIYAANLFLATADSVDLEYLRLDPSDAQQAKYEAYMGNIKQWKYEARFLRAFYYFELVKRYGGLPVLTKPYNSNTGFPQVERNSLDSCMNFIVSECDSAALHLPDKSEDSDFGRANKAAAMLLKSRVLLYAASDFFNDPSWAAGYAYPELISLSQDAKTREDRWKDAAAAANEIIKIRLSLGRNISSGYQEIFSAFTNQEIILARRYIASNSFEKANYPIGYDLGNSGATPTQDLVDAYEMIDGSDFDWNNPEHAANPYANRDPRLTFSILTNNTVFKGRPVELWTGGKDGKGVSRASKTGYYLLKYVNPDLNLLQNYTSVHSWIIMRYSEVILNYAEAMNEAYGPNNNNGNQYTARQAVNLIRRRGSVRIPELPAAITQAELKEKIRNERRVDFAFEDHRLWDLRRWMTAPDVLNKPVRGVEITKTGEDAFEYKTVVVENRIFLPNMYLYPIPQSDINLTGWEQNPGW